MLGALPLDTCNPEVITDFPSHDRPDYGDRRIVTLTALEPALFGGVFWLGKLERAKGFEPSTPTLARLCSTPELHPLTRRIPEPRNADRGLYRHPAAEGNTGSRPRG